MENKEKKVTFQNQIPPLNFGPLKTGQVEKKKTNLLEPGHVYSKVEEVGSFKKKPANMMRIVCVSDTHSRQRDIQWKFPQGDVIVHTGDFTFQGRADEIEQFVAWFSKLPYKYKIVIAGNHEITFDLEEEKNLSRRFFGADEIPGGFSKTKDILTSCKDIIYLEESSVTIQGLKFWGSPYQPIFHDWAFNRDDDKRAEIYSRIPEDVDVLLSHGPPFQILDRCVDGTEAGCPILQDEIFNRIKPKLVVFGHIHEDAGHQIIDDIHFVNASVCNYRYKPVNPAICVDLEISEPFEEDLGGFEDQGKNMLKKCNLF